MKKAQLRLLARDTLRMMAKDDGEPMGVLVIPRGTGGWNRGLSLLGKVKGGQNLFHEEEFPVEEIAESANAILRDARPKHEVGEGRKPHLKISREAWDKLLKLRKRDIVAFLHEFQNRRLHRIHAPVA